MGFSVANEVDGLIGVDSRGRHSALYASGDLDMKPGVRQSGQARRFNYALGGQSGIAGRRVYLAVVGQQAGLPVRA